jgi:prephenate dehydrogenase
VTSSATVAVVGLGLIGGSVARALASRGVEVIAFDRDAKSIAAAIEEGVVKRALGEDLGDIADAGTVVIALPGDAARELIRNSARAFEHATLVMDVGSAKQLVVRAAEDAGIGAKFVGCHPLAGDHRSGWTSSRPDMFLGNKVFICPSSRTSDQAMKSAAEFWELMGATPVMSDAGAHDSRMAWVSHLPHVLSSALALTLRDAGLARAELGPGGRDMTRLAGSSPDMWTPIAHENAEAITAAISAFEEHLSTLKKAVADRNAEIFRSQFSAGSEWFEKA